uniref:Cation-transporting ATPase n=1 Tax=Felis catus TaxID=9685 RepID=A0ABI7VUD7_FELCA
VIKIFIYQTLCLITTMLTCGVLLLVFYWKPQWRVWANCNPCPLQEADTVLLRTTDEFQRYTRKKVICLYLATLKFPISKNPEEPLVADRHSVINHAVLKPELKLRYIQVRKIRYVWDNLEKRFQKVGLLEDSNSCYDIHHTFGRGLTSEEQEVRRLVCGPNAIEVEIQPIWKLLIKQVLNPFYVFQAFTLTLWLSQGYIEYSVAIIILSIISIVLSVYDLRQQSVKLHNLVEDHNKVQVTVMVKDKGLQKLESHLLVPGDTLILPGKTSLPCDAILIDGSCVVTEGMLTGESIPVTKTPLPYTENTVAWKSHSLEDYRKHVLFCGTELIQVKPSGQGPVRAVVLQTGYNTAKGDLVRSILYPRPLNFKLYNDAFKFIVFLAFLGIVGFFYALGVYMYHGVSPRDTATMALLLLTVTVPPVLPAALTTGIVYAQKRLKKKKIFCISPQRINMCGQINLVCFDKTGTLTEDGLDLWGTVPTADNCFQEVNSFASGKVLPWGPLCAAMTSCHSLILLNGTIQGDPLDLKMFEGTAWIMEDCDADYRTFGMPGSNIIIKPGPKASWSPVEAIAILRQFPFSSSLQRMSVVAQVAGEDHFHVYMKGAPEMLAKFCKSETVPKNFPQELRKYTIQGFRVIAFAHKGLKMKKEKVESDLTFLGLLIMENRLKKESKSVLKELHEACIRTVMITGDNLQTAITVAKNSEMIPGGSQVILVEAKEPEDLVPASVTWQLVENQENGPEKNVSKSRGSCYHFAMSGKSYQVIFQHFNSLLPKILVNGTIFALKMAHAGISLSEQEASVASPFTSKIANIACVPHLIREGRAALVSSFGVFKYLTMYGIIQLIGTSLLYWLFGNYQYLMQDVAITLMVLSSTHAYPKLAPYRPAGQLLSPPLLLSVFLNTCFTCIVQICAFLYVKQQPWYCENNELNTALEARTESSSFESTTLWPLTTINCITAAFIFSKGKPFRKPIYTNYIFSFLLISALGLTVFILFSDFQDIYRGMEVSGIHFHLWSDSYDFILQNRKLWLWIKKEFGFYSKSQYRHWQKTLAEDSTWPPTNRTDYSGDGEYGFYINRGYESPEEIPKAKLGLEGQTTEQHFWTRL